MNPRSCPQHGYNLPGGGCPICNSEVEAKKISAKASKISSCEHCYCIITYDKSHKVCCNCDNKQSLLKEQGLI